MIAKTGGAVFLALIVAAVASYARATLTSDSSLPPDARSQGMGRAFTAVAEGPSAIWWNPGGLGLLEGIWLTPYSKREILIDKAAQHSFGLAGARRGRGAAIHLDHLRYPSVDIIGIPEAYAQPFQPWEYTVRAGAGIDLARHLFQDRSPGLELGLGMGVKYVRAKLAPGRFSGISGTGTGWGLDLGALMAFRRSWTGHALPDADFRESGFYGLRAGVTAPNLIQRRLHFDGLDSRDPLGREVRVGFAAEAALPQLASAPRLGSPLHFVAAADGKWGLEKRDRTPIWHAGLEGRVFEFISGRAGYIRDQEGDIKDWTYGLGVGFEASLSPASRIRALGWRLDYASIPVAEMLDDRLDQYTFSTWLLW